jgi:hypothetical protein
MHKKLFFQKLKIENFSISKNNIVCAKATKVLQSMIFFFNFFFNVMSLASIRRGI